MLYALEGIISRLAASAGQEAEVEAAVRYYY